MATPKIFLIFPIVVKPRCPKCKTSNPIQIDVLLRTALAMVLLAYSVYLAISAYKDAPAIIGTAIVFLIGSVYYQLYGLKNDYRIWMCRKCWFRFYYKK